MSSVGIAAADCCHGASVIRFSAEQRKGTYSSLLAADYEGSTLRHRHHLRWGLRISCVRGISAGRKLPGCVALGDLRAGNTLHGRVFGQPRLHRVWYSVAASDRCHRGRHTRANGRRALSLLQLSVRLIVGDGDNGWICVDDGIRGKSFLDGLREAACHAVQREARGIARVSLAVFRRRYDAEEAAMALSA